MGKAKILLVEDQSVISTNIKLLLKKKDFDVIGVATTGENAIQFIEAELPDLVLMDISLPGKLDGIQTAEIIKARWDIPIIYITARTDDATIERAKATGVYGYISKDIKLKDQLPLLIDFALLKHKSEKEKLEAQELLKYNEEKFRSIASSARDAIIYLDNDGLISFWNNSAERIFGYSDKEALGKKLSKLISPESLLDIYNKGFYDYRETGKGTFVGNTVELDVKKKNGTIFPVELSLSSVKLKGKWCACGIIRDITSRKISEEEMERLIEEIQLSRDLLEQHASELVQLNYKLAISEEELTKLNADKDKFFSIIAHDLKGPFQNLMACSKILKDDINNLSNVEIQDFASYVNSSASQLFKLLENLLEWSRIQRGAIVMKPETFYLEHIIDMNINIFAPIAKQKNILIEKIMCEDDIMVYTDANMTNTIIRNLCSNAIKFTPNNGSISIKAEKLDKKFAQVSIIDSGVGMDEATIQKVFEINQHHTTLGTNKETGTGLGLVLVNELVQQIGGKLNVQSEMNLGTTFSFTMPLSSL